MCIFYDGQIYAIINFFPVKCRILTNRKKIPLTPRLKDALKGQDKGHLVGAGSELDW